MFKGGFFAIRKSKYNSEVSQEWINELHHDQQWPLYGSENKLTTTIHYNTHAPYRYNDAGKQSDPKENMLYDSIHIKFKSKQNIFSVTSQNSELGSKGWRLRVKGVAAGF